ncbi:MAG: YjfK family protein [Nitrospirae bacterium YQR-1]
MSGAGIFRHIHEKSKVKLTGVFRKKPERIDINLPLGIKINSMIRLDETKFITNADVLKVQSPGGGIHTVVAGEKFMIGSLKVYRFYIEENESRNQSVLQIPVANDEIEGIVLYQIIEEVYPQSDEQWDFWLNEGTGCIGYKDFKIQEEDGKETLYYRLWGGDERYTKPIFFRSVISTDSYGITGMKTESHGMVYGREISETLQEYLFIVHEKLLDNDRELEEAKVVLMAGIDIDLAEIDVLV